MKGKLPRTFGLNQKEAVVSKTSSVVLAILLTILRVIFLPPLPFFVGLFVSWHARKHERLQRHHPDSPQTVVGDHLHSHPIN